MRSPGLMLLCLLPLLTACGGRQIVRPEPVEIRVPVTVAVPAEILQQVEAPALPDGTVTNEDMAQWAEELRAWGALGWCNLARVEALQPGVRKSDAVVAKRCGETD